MELAKSIDWNSNETHLILNPRLPPGWSEKIQLKKLPRLPGHIWLASSGTTTSGSIKLYGISRTAFKISALSVNKHLNVSSKDRWLNVLPCFHVGGLSIFARAFYGRNTVVDKSVIVWNPEHFHNWVSEGKATLTSLVPTQVFDLVQLGRPLPKHLRAILVGGGALDLKIYQKARALGFPVLPTYGMTETASQVATAALSTLTANNPESLPLLKILDHVRCKMVDSHLAFSSRSLFSAQVIFKSSRPEAPEVLWRSSEWYATADLGLIKKESKSGYFYLQPMGREDDYVKISGELVHVGELTDKLRQTSGDLQSLVVAVTHPRRGNELSAILPMKFIRQAKDIILKLNAQVLPIAKIKTIYFLPEFPKTSIGKTPIKEVLNLIGLG